MTLIEASGVARAGGDVTTLGNAAASGRPLMTSGGPLFMSYRDINGKPGLSVGGVH